MRGTGPGLCREACLLTEPSDAPVPLHLGLKFRIPVIAGIEVGKVGKEAGIGLPKDGPALAEDCE